MQIGGIMNLSAGAAEVMRRTCF